MVIYHKNKIDNSFMLEDDIYKRKFKRMISAYKIFQGSYFISPGNRYISFQGLYQKSLIRI